MEKKNRFQWKKEAKNKTTSGNNGKNDDQKRRNMEKIQLKTRDKQNRKAKKYVNKNFKKYNT